MCFWPRCYFTVEIGAIGKTADMIRAVQEVSSILVMRSCIDVVALARQWCRLLARVIGVGIETADMLVQEVLSRNMRDRRAVACGPSLAACSIRSRRASSICRI